VREDGRNGRHSHHHTLTHCHYSPTTTREEEEEAGGFCLLPYQHTFCHGTARGGGEDATGTARRTGNAPAPPFTAHPSRLALGRDGRTNRAGTSTSMACQAASCMAVGCHLRPARGRR